MKRPLQILRHSHPLWFGVTGTALIAATYGLARLGFGFFLPAFSATFALTPSVSGLISSGASILYCISAGIGFHYAALQPRLITLLAGLSATVGSLGIAGAQTTPVFAAAVLLAGMGAGFASPALVELVQRNIAPSGQGRLQSVVNSGTGFGVVIAGVLVLVLGDTWRVAWMLVAVIAAASTLGVLHLDGRRDRDRASSPGGESRPSLIARNSFRGLTKPLLGAFVFGIGCSAVWVYGRITLEDTGGMTTEESAGAWIALGIGGAGATLIARWLASRPVAITWTVTVLGTACATALIGAAPTTFVLAYTGAILFGLAYTAATSALILWASAVTPNSAAGTSALFIALVLGQAAGAPMIGVLVEASTIPITFTAAAMSCAASSLIVLGKSARPAPHRSA